MKNAVIANLKSIRNAQRKIVRASLMKGGEIFQKEAASRAPVDQGDLRDSIDTQLTSNKSSEIVVSVGPTGEGFHGVFQEFGTSQHSANQFMRPAYDAKGEKVLDQVSKDVFIGIDRVISEGVSVLGGKGKPD